VISFAFRVSRTVLLQFQTSSWSIVAIAYGTHNSYLWPPCVADANILFYRCGYYLFSFFPRLFSLVADWMSTILPHMM